MPVRTKLGSSDNPTISAFYGSDRPSFSKGQHPPQTVVLEDEDDYGESTMPQCLWCYSSVMSSLEITMTLKERLIQEIEHTPDILLEQVFNFLQFLKTNPLSQTSRLSGAEHPIQPISDEARLVRLNQLFGAWQDQPDLDENFTAIDRSRHAYHGRSLDSLND